MQRFGDASIYYDFSSVKCSRDRNNENICLMITFLSKFLQDMTTNREKLQSFVPFREYLNLFWIVSSWKKYVYIYFDRKIKLNWNLFEMSQNFADPGSSLSYEGSFYKILPKNSIICQNLFRFRFMKNWRLKNSYLIHPT